MIPKKFVTERNSEEFMAKLKFSLFFCPFTTRNTCFCYKCNCISLEALLRLWASMADEEGNNKEGAVDDVDKDVQAELVMKKNRFENWLLIYLPLAWLAQLGNGVIQTITGRVESKQNQIAFCRKMRDRL